MLKITRFDFRARILFDATLPLNDPVVGQGFNHKEVGP